MYNVSSRYFLRKTNILRKGKYYQKKGHSTGTISL